MAEEAFGTQLIDEDKHDEYAELLESTAQRAVEDKQQVRTPKLDLIFGIVPQGGKYEARFIYQERQKTILNIGCVTEKPEGHRQELRDSGGGMNQQESEQQETIQELMEGKYNLVDLIMKRIIISPQRAGYFEWKLTVLLFSVLSSMMYANFAAFRYDVDFSGYIDYYENVNFGFNQMDKYTVSQISRLNKIQIGFEIFFCIEMLLGFITEYIDNNNRPVRDFKKISKKYLNEGFIYDVIPLIPCNFMFHFPGSRFFFLIKSVRLIQAYEILDVKQFNKSIGEFFKKQLDKVCQDEEKAIDDEEDNTHIVKQIVIKYVLRTIKLTISIMIIAYFTGILFFIWCDLTQNFNVNLDTGNMIHSFASSGNQLNYKNPSEATLAMMYWAFTTLSTVGLGDYYPVSFSERFLAAFGFMIGVAVFAYVMGNFLEILIVIKNINEDLEDGDKLAGFIGLLKNFNKDEDISQSLKDDIEDYFEYRWMKNKNWSVESESDLQILAQLPEQIQGQVFTDCLYSHFYYKFRKHFTFQDMHNHQQHSYLTMNDTQYRNYMLTIFKNLNPIMFTAGSLIMSELDDVNIVTFVMSGKYHVGYEINHKVQMKLQFQSQTIIGGFECSHDRRCIYVYKAQNEVEGFFIRKQQWKQLLNDYPDLYGEQRAEITRTYWSKVHKPLEKLKNEDVKRFDIRADYKQVLVLRDYDPQELDNIFLAAVRPEVAVKPEEDAISSGDKELYKAVKANALEQGKEKLKILANFGEHYDNFAELNSLLDHENKELRENISWMKQFLKAPEPKSQSIVLSGDDKEQEGAPKNSKTNSQLNTDHEAVKNQVSNTTDLADVAGAQANVEQQEVQSPLVLPGIAAVPNTRNMDALLTEEHDADAVQASGDIQTIQADQLEPGKDQQHEDTADVAAKEC